jgi:predicted transcriptional regulator
MSALLLGALVCHSGIPSPSVTAVDHVGKEGSRSNLLTNSRMPSPSVTAVDHVSKEGSRSNLLTNSRMPSPSVTAVDHVGKEGSRSNLLTNSRMPSPGLMAIDDEVKEESGSDLLTKIKNHVVQIGTGEGKSVTVAVSAILLALLGFEVDVVCYSEYLTDRDKQSFEHMFDAFRLKKLISYGTFDVISNKFINRRGDVRESVRSIISGVNNGINWLADRDSATPRILLVDEVDVFFDEQLYSSCYVPSLTLRGPEITAFIKELWTFHKRGDRNVLTVTSIMQWPIYNACRVIYKGWEFLIDNSLSHLIEGLKHFDSPSHIYHVDIAGDRIGLKHFDGINYNYVSYRILFAYFKEYENGNITKAGLERNICLLDGTCGSFSYAALPKMYDSILGVSGTLQELNTSQKKLLRDEYNVKKATHLPSVYGSNKLTFDANATCAIKITNVVEYHKEIVNEISLQIKGKFKDRAVLVFFETKKALDDFLASPAMNELRGQVRVIREEDTAADRELTVRQSVTSKSITLMSRNFGRGTDFICFDDDMDASGGVHVIQTFVSLDVSEEKQIKGRTARQGNQGSYSLVLLDTKLEAINISIEIIRKFEASGQRYTEIDRYRRAMCDTTFQKGLSSLKSNERNHRSSVAFLEALHRNDVHAVKEFLVSTSST